MSRALSYVSIIISVITLVILALGFLYFPLLYRGPVGPQGPQASKGFRGLLARRESRDPLEYQDMRLSGIIRPFPRV